MKPKKPLPKWAPLAGIVGGGLLVLLAGWMLLVSAQSKKAASLERQTADVRQKISANLAAAAAAKSATPAQTIRVADVYKLAKAMPSSEDMPDLLIELSQVTKDAGVAIQTLSPGTPTPNSGGGQLVPITMGVSGDFFSITDLLYRLRNFVYVRHGALEASGRLFTLDSVSLSGAGGKVSAQLSMHAYVYGAPPVVVPTPTPTASGTDTGTSTTTPSSGSTPGGPSAAGAP